MTTITLGSLFDGSGGFPLAGSLHGIIPLWASEIEKYPIAVTTARFPNMKHLGDVCSINGGEIEPVDIITFGSPCQDMSIAGVRAGLEGSRSNLFYEAIRIITEMRTATNGTYPRYAVWENVFGAFSSNKGHDFKAVLEAFASVTVDTVYGPFHEVKGGKLKWTNAGIINGEISSIAWRTLDAQYWGVPQRRRRIYLVADFRGHSAGEVLFDPEGVCGNPATGREAREGAAADVEGGVGGGVFNESGQGYWMPGYGCLRAEGENRPSRPGHVVCAPDIFHSLTSTNTRCTESAQQPNYVCYDTTQITSPHNKSNPQDEDPCHTLSAQQHPPLAVSIDARNLRETPISGTLQAKSGGGYSLNYQNPVVMACGGSETLAVQRVTGTLSANSHPGSYCGQDAYNDMLIPQRKNRKYIVRRLMPIECARLQGFPDWWGEIDDKKLQSDSAQYRMWGNGIALPCAAYVMRGIAKQVRKEPTKWIT